MKTKLQNLFIALAMLLSFSGWAQFNFITNADDTITITGYTGVGGDVTIPDAVGIYPVTIIGSLAFVDQTTVTSVIIPGSVTNIGSYAFQECSGLKNITVNATNPSYASAGGVLFNKSLTTLIQYPPKKLADSYTIPNGVTSIAIVRSMGVLA